MMLSTNWTLNHFTISMFHMYEPMVSKVYTCNVFVPFTKRFYFTVSSTWNRPEPTEWAIFVHFCRFSPVPGTLKS
jgi:hypothetical protein